MTDNEIEILKARAQRALAFDHKRYMEVDAEQVLALIDMVAVLEERAEELEHIADMHDAPLPTAASYRKSAWD